MIVQNALRRCAALSAAALLALAGCSGAEAGGESASEDQAALTELSDRLVDGEGHAYTAEYLVEGSEKSVLVAVDPEAGTAAVVVGDRPRLWTNEESTDLAVWLSRELEGILPAEDAVASWLSATAADPSASTEFSDTTLAGELADCVEVRGAEGSPVGAYEVCVTTVGVIASVTAKVGGTAYTAKLVNYHDGVDAAWLSELTGQATGHNQ
ncbi:hypothetical protein K3N28_07890 [Glycomyces sp. TRM65418]|uniref:hypothetical protein n=1 Tax=Glycomyces sp. TRM65418 TaxID=2867006 RepID=UPI001CE50007|nr:hypothetical protein [Glycomyces sp. TRM65418]MCC3762991.1 hypothetical protein [Glycomyces sp. TRM65418]QZD57008.1 hypothetical protein K3N28_07840 [Glycomyces sp. TRM65418]